MDTKWMNYEIFARWYAEIMELPEKDRVFEFFVLLVVALCTFGLQEE